MKKYFFVGLFSIYFMTSIFADGIVTAKTFFDQVSSFYASLKTYEAVVDIKANRTNMSGKVSFKRPSLLRIDFTSPSEQVICFNGDMLTIYLPGSSAILNQSVQGNSGANMATAQGLSLMSRYYSVSYEKNSTPTPLDDNNPELVVKLVLSRKNTTEAFRYIKMAVVPESKVIRRIEGITPQGESFVFSFRNYQFNTEIPDNRFVYDAPSSANNYNNFLFSE